MVGQRCDFPPVPPVNAAVPSPRSRAVVSARRTFGLLPDVEMPSARSPGRPMASIWRAKIVSKPMSRWLPRSKMLVSVVSAMAAMAARSAWNRTVSSVARCCASLALPPLPKNKILPPLRIAVSQAAEHVGKGLREIGSTSSATATMCLHGFVEEPSKAAYPPFFSMKWPVSGKFRWRRLGRRWYLYLPSEPSGFPPRRRGWRTQLTVPGCSTESHTSCRLRRSCRLSLPLAS